MQIPPKNKVYYLASPYSHPNPIVKQMRYLLAAAAGAELFKKGYTLLEPIATSHPAASLFSLPTGYASWMERDRRMIEKADGLIVLTLPGWTTSTGVSDEIDFAHDQYKPVHLVNPEELLGKEFFSDLQEAVDV